MASNSKTSIVNSLINGIKNHVSSVINQHNQSNNAHNNIFYSKSFFQGIHGNTLTLTMNILLGTNYCTIENLSGIGSDSVEIIVNNGALYFKYKLIKENFIDDVTIANIDVYDGSESLWLIPLVDFHSDVPLVNCEQDIIDGVSLVHNNEVIYLKVYQDFQQDFTNKLRLVLDNYMEISDLYMTPIVGQFKIPIDISS